MLETHGNVQMHRKHRDNDEIDIRGIIEAVIVNKWLILVITALAMVIGWIYSTTISTMYQSTALIQIENKSQGIGIGGMQGGASNGVSSGLGGVSGGVSSVQVETALIKSHFVLQPIVELLGLNVKVVPHYFPVLSKFFIHFHKSKRLTLPFLGMNRYAWGGEKINVKQLKVPPQFFDSNFRIVAKGNETYELYTAAKKLVLQGKVGEEVESSIIPGVKIWITELDANVGTEFNLIQQSSGGVADGIDSNLMLSDIGSGQGVGTGILNVVLNGTDQQSLPLTLNTIINYDIQRNIDKKNVEIQKTLDFLGQQAPILKNSLEQTEAALSDLKSNYGAGGGVGISTNTGGVGANSGGISFGGNIFLDKLVALDKSIEEIKLKKGELLQSFTEKHPIIISLTRQQKRLEQELLVLEDKLKSLPKTEQKILGLTRDIKVKEQMYMLILGRIQELQITQAGSVSDVRLLTPAASAVELPSKQLTIIAAAALIGFLLSIAIIFTRKALTQGVDDPDYVEDYLGIPTYAVLPYSREQKKLAREVKRNIYGTGPFVLAASKPKDLVIEGLRSLRTMLQFNLQEADSNVISVLGTSPGIGKSFVSVNLAQLFVDAGKSVLLIDADIRKGKMHLYLECKKSLGLAELLNGSSEFDEVKNKIADKFDFVACGESTGPSPVELFLSGKFQEFISNVSELYDVVVIDTPPILAVAEGVIIAQKINSVNVLLIGVGTDDLSGAERTAKILNKNGVKVNGLVFNSVTKSKNSHGYGHYGYYDDEK